MVRHGARYVSVTEEVWAGRTAPADEVQALVRGARGPVAQPELYGLVPRCLYDLRGAPLLSLSRFKGCAGWFPHPRTRCGESLGQTLGHRVSARSDHAAS